MKSGLVKRRGLGWIVRGVGVACVLGAAILGPQFDVSEAATPTAWAPANADFSVGVSVGVAGTGQRDLDNHPIPDRIWIEKLKVNAKIQPVGPGKAVGNNAVEWSAPNNRNVGWHDYSGRLGEGKNIVLNGHNNIYGSVFRKLYTLQPGDEIRLGAGDQVVSYKVEQVLRLREQGQPLDVRIANARYILPMEDDRLTIVSCWPETSNTHRVIVIARPVTPVIADAAGQ